MWWIIGIVYIIGMMLTLGILIGMDTNDEFAVTFGAMFFPITIVVAIGVKIGEFASNKCR